jgi:tetratricopeptide (TPR) repeat protein
VLRAEGDLASARTRLERSLEIQRKVHGTEDHPDVAASLYQLARVLRAEGDLDGAYTRLVHFLEIKRKVHGSENDPDVAVSLHELAGVLRAGVLRAQEDPADARAWLERVMAIKQKVHGTGEQPDIATIYTRFGDYLRDLGRELIKSAFRTDQTIRRKVFGTRSHYGYSCT